MQYLKSIQMIITVIKMLFIFKMLYFFFLIKQKIEYIIILRKFVPYNIKTTVHIIYNYEYVIIYESEYRVLYFSYFRHNSISYHLPFIIFNIISIRTKLFFTKSLLELPCNNKRTKNVIICINSKCIE